MAKTVQEYMSMGMDERTASYFAGGRRKVVKAEARSGYKLKLLFDNGEQRILDCNDCFGEGSVFNKIADPSDFSRVLVDESGNVGWDVDPKIDSNVVWSNRIDFCRDACYLNSVPI